MSSRFKRSLFIFRRDLRIDDNTALKAALELSDELIPCFIFDPRLSNKQRKHFNYNSFQFLLESLQDLKMQLKGKAANLFLFSGLPENIISQIHKDTGIDAVFFNKDYTPFSRKRDDIIEKTCTELNIDVLTFHDSLLHEPGAVLTGKGQPYRVFSQFFKKASAQEIPLPVELDADNFYSEKLSMDQVSLSSFKLFDKNPSIAVKGGRASALSVLQDIWKFDNYDKERDVPSVKGTTYLSAHNKLGTISIREFYYYVVSELGKEHTLINELHWRDFFTHIAIEFPQVFTNSFKSKYDNIQWSNDASLFKAWCLGKTGFPIVDAGMRELNVTGYMHNRVRMIVASFLVKDLHIDWRWGERYFASKLVDYDPCVNNGNWQWAASTGADSQPYFRIFNPWRQQKRFDPECIYIKQWVPELTEVDSKAIHSLEHDPQLLGVDYPQAIVDHAQERNLALSVFKAV
jgi:deoxyribodipyrimidine photo-lyase